MKLRRRAFATGEDAFRGKPDDDAVATGQLAQGISDFSQDPVKLDSLLAARFD